MTLKREEANPLAGLTTEELLAYLDFGKATKADVWAEIRARLERLEKCEAALKEIVAMECKFGTGQLVYKFDSKQSRHIARAALEGR